jgi:methyl-accepting chemotaxis protein
MSNPISGKSDVSQQVPSQSHFKDLQKQVTKIRSQMSIISRVGEELSQRIKETNEMVKSVHTITKFPPK